MKSHTVRATEFKAKRLAYLGESKSSRNSSPAKGRIAGDIVNCDFSGLWEAV